MRAMVARSTMFGAVFCSTGERLGQNLERDVSRQVAVACPIHFSHAAGTDERDLSQGPRRAPGARLTVCMRLLAASIDESA